MTTHPIELAVDPAVVTTFLLVLARTSAWVISAPLLSQPGLAGLARLAFAVALSGFLTPLAKISGDVPDLATFVTAAVSQVLIGLALGFLTNLVVYAVQMAGSLTDLMSGFSFGTLLDPVSGAESAAFARLITIAFTTLLFATDAYQAIVAGFAQSFRALPVDHLPRLSGSTGAVIGQTLAGLMVAALEIGAPLLGVLFLTDVAVAMVARLVPQANALSLALPLKALIALGAAGLMLAMLPSHLSGLLDPALRLPGSVLR